MHTVKNILRQNDSLTKVDLKDAYFMIPIREVDRPNLCFLAQHRQFQFTCLQFGLSCAPWVSTKTLKLAIYTLRELEIRLVVYIYDILVMAESKDLAKNHTKASIFLLESLGFIAH